MKDGNIHLVIRILRHIVAGKRTPAVTEVSKTSHSPFKVLISCLLSLRTKDEITSSAARRLFGLADNPKAMLELSSKEIEEAIYPVGFYRNKARTILQVCHELLKKYNSRGPDELDELLKLKGVGRKTANLVITLGYGKPGICVDTHVHRISNRWSYTKTSSPKETEFVLREKLPKEYWIEFNDLLVAFGQHICRPISPKCSLCGLERFCDRVGVKTSR